jgi:hypothetical protein
MELAAEHVGAVVLALECGEFGATDASVQSVIARERRRSLDSEWLRALHRSERLRNRLRGTGLRSPVRAPYSKTRRNL